tara:strand:- start:57 stop:1427 length:1371 start_codon:yes stop_codon:yes gene_type:complete
MIARLLLTVLFGSSVTIVSYAENALGPAMSLEAVYRMAVDQAPSLAVARYRVDSAEAQSAEAAGALLPQLSVFGEWTDNTLGYDGPLSAVYEDQSYNGERYGFRARQSLFDVARFRELQRREVLSDLSESELAEAEIELLGAVADAYLTVVVADDTVRQFQTESTALEKQLEEARALYARALLPVTQVLETQTRSETVKADLIEAEGDAAIARERLTELIDIRGFQLMPIAESVVLTASVTAVEDAVERALRNSPSVSVAEEGLKAADYGVKREKGGFWPEVNLVISDQYSDVGFDNLTSPPRNVESVAISVNYPLLAGGARMAKIRGARAEYYTAREELERVKRATETQTRSAWVKLSAAKKRIAAAQRALETSDVNVSAAQKSVRAGTARVTDVLVALAQRTRAQRDRVYAEQQHVMAWLELELITGNAPRSVAPILSDALLNRGSVSALQVSQ